MILLTIVLLASLLAPEQLLSVIVGTMASYHLTNFLKNKTGAMGAGAAILAFAVAFIIAVVAFLVSTILSGGQVSWETISQNGFVIFGLATLAYKLMCADGGNPTATAPMTN